MDRILHELSAGDRSELINKIGTLLERISSLIEVAHQLSGSHSLGALLRRLVGIITEVMGAERSSLFLYDAGSDELYSRVAEGSEGAEIRFDSHSGIAGSVFQTGNPVIITDAYADSRFNQAVDLNTGFQTRNILCAPLRNTRGEIMGVAEVLNKKCGDFNEDDLVLLGALTSQAASAIENVDLIERVESAWQEESRLFELANAVASELQIDALLERIVAVTTEILAADRSTLFLHDDATNELWSHIAERLKTREIRFPDSAGIAGACFASGNMLNIADPYADPRFNREVDRKTGYRTHSILCAPIINRDGDKLGVLHVLNRLGGAFDARD
jgi:adenylate cyclase